MWCEVSVISSWKAKYRWYGALYFHYFVSPAATSLIRPLSVAGAVGLSSGTAAKLAFKAANFLGVKQRFSKWVLKRYDRIRDRFRLRRPARALRIARKLARNTL